MPGAGFIVVEPEFGLGGLETVLDRPALALDGDQRLDAGPARAPSGKVGAFPIGNAAADQQATGPQAGAARVVLLSRKVGEWEMGRVIEPGPVGGVARRQALPERRIEIAGD